MNGRPCRRIAVLTLVLAVLTACAGVQDAQSPRASMVPATPPAADMQSLWGQLRAGVGFVVLLRHAATEAGTGDPPGFRLDDCETQRNLSDVGRAQAAQLGDLFRTQGISIRQVLSSQYCRCLETAELMNLGTVEPAPMLNSIFEDRTNEAAQTGQVRQQIFEHRGRAGVLLMVTHAVNIRAVSGVSVRPGEAVIVRGTSEGDLEVVGRLY